MGRFEQRISEDAVTAARTKIEAGATLRSAAAEIPCAPSTLSLRIKKAKAAEAASRDGALSGEQDLSTVGRAEYVRELKRIALGHDPTANARDRLTALKELLKLEPSASTKAAAGAVYHVYPEGRVVEGAIEDDDIVRGEDGEDVSEP